MPLEKVMPMKGIGSLTFARRMRIPLFQEAEVGVVSEAERVLMGA